MVDVVVVMLRLSLVLAGNPKATVNDRKAMVRQPNRREQVKVEREKTNLSKKHSTGIERPLGVSLVLK
jgi:hypothetical protein